MQIRHKNRELYFKELETTSENFILPYIKSIKNIHTGSRVLEVGYGEGGNLLPFAKMGCDVVGVDLSIFNEPLDCIEELLSIKRTKCPIEYFELIIGNSNLKTIKRQFYLINPHYKIKFGLPPVRLPLLISKIPYLRNYFTTSAFYILSFDT